MGRIDLSQLRSHPLQRLVSRLPSLVSRPFSCKPICFVTRPRQPAYEILLDPKKGRCRTSRSPMTPQVSREINRRHFPVSRPRNILCLASIHTEFKQCFKRFRSDYRADPEVTRSDMSSTRESPVAGLLTRSSRLVQILSFGCGFWRRCTKRDAHLSHPLGSSMARGDPTAANPQKSGEPWPIIITPCL